MSKVKLTRREASQFLKERGYPVAWTTLQKLACIGGGPEYQRFGNRTLYTPERLIDWAEAKLSAPRHSTSEAA